MDNGNEMRLHVGSWCVDPASGQISREGEVVRLEARTMRLLLCLAERAGQVVSIDDLLRLVWPGVIVTPDSVYQAVAALRRLLHDEAKQPAYIATVPRLGYRMVATVSKWTNGSSENPPPEAATDSNVESKARGGSRARAVMLAGAVACLVLGLAFLAYNVFANRAALHLAGTPQKSIAVLPFRDLTTQAMDEEYFADGLTEELIDRLSKIPGLRVPAPASSFYVRGKKLSVAEVGQLLGVAYVLDGSVRKSESMLRIATRLIRADDGYIIWSQTYDRPAEDILRVQDDIAADVTKTLRASLR